MAHDEHELLVEYSEMTSINLGLKEYQEIKKDVLKLTDAVKEFDWSISSIANFFSFKHSC